MRLFKIYLSLFSLLLLASCASLDKQKENPSPQKLATCINVEPPSLDPRRGVDAVSAQVQRMILTGLTFLNADNQTELALADSYDLSSDRKKYTFHLKKTCWSDGSPLTASDFEKTWKSVLEPSFPAPNVSLFYLIKNAQAAKEGVLPIGAVGVCALDDLTLEIELEKPHSSFLDALTNTTFCPLPRNMRENPIDLNHYIGCGPFKIKHYNFQNEIVLEKNPLYFGATDVKLDELRFYIVKDERTAQLLYDKGEVDWLSSVFASIPLDTQAELLKTKKLHQHPASSTNFLIFNFQKAPLNNIHIRKALTLALNRRSLVENILNGAAIPAQSFVPPLQKKNRWHPYFADASIEEARNCLLQGLEEEGLTLETFPTLKLTYNQTELWKRVVQVVQATWEKALGIHVELECVDFPALLQKLSQRDFDISRFGWHGLYDDPVNFLEIFRAGNHAYIQPGWKNATFETLLDQANQAKSQEERWVYLEEAEKIFFENMPICPLFHPDTTTLQKSHLKDMVVSPLSISEFRWAYIEEKEKKN